MIETLCTRRMSDGKELRFERTIITDISIARALDKDVGTAEYSMSCNAQPTYPVSEDDLVNGYAALFFKLRDEEEFTAFRTASQRLRDGNPRRIDLFMHGMDIAREQLYH